MSEVEQIRGRARGVEAPGWAGGTGLETMRIVSVQDFDRLCAAVERATAIIMDEWGYDRERAEGWLFEGDGS